jgi:hypothetical protein
LSNLSVDYLETRVLMLLSRHHRVGKIDVFIARELHESTSTILKLIDAASQLLARPSVRPHGVLGRYIKRLLVGRFPHCVAEWHEAAAVCYLDQGLVTNPQTTAVELASVLVHEAQHARLGRLGVSYTGAHRLRIEKLCVETELDFARRTPEGAALIKRLEHTLDHAGHIWDPRRLVELRATMVEGFLRDLKAPAWVQRMMLAVIRRRAA